VSIAGLQELQRKLVLRLQEVAAETGVPGIAVSASISGTEVAAQVGHACLEKGSRLSDSSRFEISCLMKFLISSFAMQEVVRGNIRPDAPIAEYLPEFEVQSLGGRPICIGDLMSHCSGLRGLDISQARVKWTFSWEQLVLHIRANRPSFPPGSMFNYEHSEHVLLAEILSRRFGAPLGELLSNEIFGPLRVELGSPKADRQSDARYVGQHAFASAAGRYVASPMPAFGSFWKYSLPDSTLTLSEIRRAAEWVMRAAGGRGLTDELTRPVIGIPTQVPSGKAVEVLPKAFGRICAQYGGGVVGHNGSSFGQTIALRMDVPADISIVVGVNAWVPAARDRAADVALRILRGEGSENRYGPDSTPVQFEIEELCGDFSYNELEGTYAGSYGTQVIVTEQDGKLTLKIGSDRSELTRISIARAPTGRYRMTSPRPASCAFVPHPTDSTPVCFLGVHSYRKLGT
jgi:CubicO group peptidase (beta-lactamase class C family)